MEFNEQMFIRGDDEGNIIRVGNADWQAFKSDKEVSERYTHPYVPYVDRKGNVKFAKDGEDESEEWQQANKDMRPARVFRSGDIVAKEDTLEWLRDKYPDEPLKDVTDENMVKFMLSIGRPDLVSHSTMVDMGLHDNVTKAAFQGFGEGLWQGVKNIGAGIVGTIGDVGALLPGIDHDNALTRTAAKMLEGADPDDLSTKVGYGVGNAIPYLALTAATAGAGAGVGAAGTGAGVGAAGTGAGVGAAGTGAGVGAVNLANLAVRSKNLLDAGNVTWKTAATLAVPGTLANAANTGRSVYEQTGDENDADKAALKAAVISYPINVVTGKILPMGYDNVPASLIKGSAIGAVDAVGNMAAMDMAGADVNAEDYFIAGSVGAAAGALIRGFNQSKTLKEMSKIAEDINALDDAEGIGFRAYPLKDGKWEIRRYVKADQDVSPNVTATGVGGDDVADAAEALQVRPLVPDTGVGASSAVASKSASDINVDIKPQASQSVVRPGASAGVNVDAVVGSHVLDSIIEPNKIKQFYSAELADDSKSLGLVIESVNDDIKSVYPPAADDINLALHETYSYLVNKLGVSEERAGLEMYEKFFPSFRGPHYSVDPLKRDEVDALNLEWERGVSSRLHDFKAYARGNNLPLDARAKAIQGENSFSVDGKNYWYLPEESTETKAVYLLTDEDGIYPVYIDKTTPVDAGELLTSVDESITGSRLTPQDVIDAEVEQAEVVDSVVGNYSKHEGIKPSATDEISAQKQFVSGSEITGGVSDLVDNVVETPAQTVAQREMADKAFRTYQRAIDGENVSPEEMSELAKVVDSGVPVSVVRKELVGNPKMQWPIRGCVIKTPADVAGLTNMIRNPYQEISKIIWLNDKGQVIDARITALGVNDATYINMHGSFADIPKGAKYFIHSHNHPSGVTEPSNADKSARRSLQRMGKEMGVEMLDDIITNGHSYYSFTENLKKNKWSELAKNNAGLEYPPNQPRFDENYKSEWEVEQIGKLVKYDSNKVRAFAEQLSTHNSEANWFVFIGNHNQVYGVIKAADTIPERISQIASAGVNRVVEIVGTKGDKLAGPTIKTADEIGVRYDAIRINREGVAISAPLIGRTRAQRMAALSNFVSEEVMPRYVSESSYAAGETNHDAVSQLTKRRGEVVTRGLRGLAEDDVANVKAPTRLPATLFSLVEVSKYLSSNGYPAKIVSRIRGGKLGAFRFDRSNGKYVPGSGRIILDSGIFKIVSDEERAQLRAEITESVNQRVFDSEELRQATIVKEYEEALAKRTVENLGKNSERARKVFAATIGSWLDVLPEMPIARGNILARIAKLHHFSKRYLVPEGVDSLSAEERKAIVEQSAAAFPTSPTLSPAERKAIMLQRRNMTISLTDEAMRKKGCLVVGDVRNEMEALVAWNLGMPSCPEKIARSSSELFNQAFSAWINFPGEVKNRAPLYYQLMDDTFSRDPAVRQVLDTLDDAIRKEREIMNQRDISDYFAELGDGQAQVLQNKLDAQDKIDAVSVVSWWQQLQSVFVSMETPLLSAMQYIPDIKVRENAIAAVYEFMRGAGVVREIGLRQYSQMVMQPMQLEHVIRPGEFDAYLMLKRIAYDNIRMNVANYNGEDANSARAKLEKYQMDKPEKWEVLQRLDKLHREWTRKYFVEPLKTMGVYSADMLNMIEQNVDTFVHFSIDQGGIGGEYAAAIKSSYGFMIDPKIRKTKGSFDLMAKITSMDVAHKLAIVSWANRNKNLYNLLEGFMLAQERSPLLKNEADKIVKREVPLGGSPTMLRRGSHSTVVVMKDGRLICYDVPKVIENFVNPSDVDALEQLIVGGVTSLNNIIKNLQTKRNIMWGFLNFFRDMFDSSILLPESAKSKIFRAPGVKINLTLMSHVRKAYPHALKRLRGELTPEFEKFLTESFAGVAEMEYSSMRTLLRLTKPEERKNLMKLYKMAKEGSGIESAKSFLDMICYPFRYVLDVFQAFEGAMKMGAWRYLKSEFPDESDTLINQVVARYAGTPHPFTVSGFAKHILVKTGFLYVNTLSQSLYRTMERFSPMYMRYKPEVYVADDGKLRLRTKKDQSGKRERNRGTPINDKRKGVIWKDIIAYAIPGTVIMLARYGKFSEYAQKAGVPEGSKVMDYIRKLEYMSKYMSVEDIISNKYPIGIDNDGKVVMFKIPTTSLNDLYAGQFIGLVGYALQNPDDPTVKNIGMGEIIALPVKSIFSRTPLFNVWNDIEAGADAATGGDGRVPGLGGNVSPAKGQLGSELGREEFYLNLFKDAINILTGRFAGWGGFVVGHKNMSKTENLLYGDWRFLTGPLRAFISVSDRGFKENQRYYENAAQADNYLVNYAVNEMVAGRDPWAVPELAEAVSRDPNFMQKVKKAYKEQSIGKKDLWEIQTIKNPIIK